MTSTLMIIIGLVIMLGVITLVAFWPRKRRKSNVGHLTVKITCDASEFLATLEKVREEIKSMPAIKVSFEHR